MIHFASMDRTDRYFIAMTIVIPAVGWWVFYGRHKYSVKGMTTSRGGK